MNMHKLPDVVMVRSRRRRFLRLFLPLSCFLFLLGLCGPLLTAATAAADTRTEARVGIISDQTAPVLGDDVSIRLMNVSDQAMLDRIVQALGAKFNAVPVKVVYTRENDEFPQDAGLAVSFKVPVVPRGAGYLPIAPFVEALAPYAKRLRLAYVVKGPFVYRGYRETYSDKDISFTVKIPPDGNNQQAFYSMDVAISNPSLTSVAFTNYPEQGNKTPARNHLRIALALGAAIIILALGLLLALLLPRKKQGAGGKPEMIPDREAPTGGTND